MTKTSTRSMKSTRSTRAKTSARKPKFTLIKGFASTEQMSYARSMFRRGHKPKAVLAKIKELYYGPYPSQAAVSWAYIYWNREGKTTSK